MPNAPAAPVALKPQAWFEVHLIPFREAMKTGQRPARIFSTDDERWAEIEALSKKTPLLGNFKIGTVERVGENFVEGTLKVTDQIVSIRWDKARDKMAQYAATGRIGETTYADALREAEDAKKRGEVTNERLTKALEQLASNLGPKAAGAGK